MSDLQMSSTATLGQHRSRQSNRLRVTERGSAYCRVVFKVVETTAGGGQVPSIPMRQRVDGVEARCADSGCHAEAGQGAAAVGEDSCVCQTFPILRVSSRQKIQTFSTC
jgi:hypothetical protein